MSHEHHKTGITRRTVWTTLAGGVLIGAFYQVDQFERGQIDQRVQQVVDQSPSGQRDIVRQDVNRRLTSEYESSPLADLVTLSRVIGIGGPVVIALADRYLEGRNRNRRG